MKYNIYQCLKCKEKNTIYPSYWPPIHKKGILSCYKCGENEESKNVFLQKFINLSIDPNNIDAEIEKNGIDEINSKILLK